MKEKLNQLKLVFIPYLILHVSWLLITGILTFLFDVIFYSPGAGYDFFRVVMPAIISGLCVLIFLRPRIHTLDVKWSKNENGHFLYQLLIFGSMVISSSFLQSYIPAASFDLERVHTVDDINGHQINRYYQIDSIDFDSANLYADWEFSKGSRRRSNDHLNCYIIAPVISKRYTDTVGTMFGILFSNKENTPGYWSRMEVERHALEQIELLKLNVSEFEQRKPMYYEASGASNLTEDNEESGFLVLEAIYKPFADRYSKSRNGFFISFGAGLLIFFLIVCISKTDPSSLQAYHDGTILKDDWINKVLLFTIPRYPHTEGSILINIAILVYLFSASCNMPMFFPGTEKLLQAGAINFYEFHTGSYWRLVSSLFLHSGLIHLLLSIFTMGICSLALEAYIKRGWFTILFFATGIVSVMSSLIFLPDIPVVGFSGALYGYFGVIFVLLLRRAMPLEERIEYYIGLITLGGLCMMAGFLMDAVNNVAHIGGLVSGMLLGIVIPLRFAPKPGIDD